MPFIDFEKVEQLATIEELAEMLGLQTHLHGNSGQVRCACPIHSGDKDTLAISPGVRSKRGSQGVFFCQKAKSGGDRIGLVAHCMDIGQQDAAFFIQEQYGKSTDTVDSTVSKKHATVPQEQKPQGRTEKSQPARAPFDPQAFASKLQYTDEVSALDISEEDATRLGIGFVRGKVYIALRDEYGFTTGFVAYAEGQLKMPPKLLANPSVVKLKRA